MKNKKAAVSLITLCLLLVASVQGIWRESLNRPPQIGAEPGSALCAGIAMEEDTLPKRCVWFLQNGTVDITYNHPIIQSGVYFWKVSTASGDANGKMVIAK